MAVHDNILQFRPRSSESASRASKRAVKPVVEQASAAKPDRMAVFEPMRARGIGAEARRTDSARGGRVQEMQSKPRPRVLERSRVPSMDSFSDAVPDSSERGRRVAYMRDARAEERAGLLAERGNREKRQHYAEAVDGYDRDRYDRDIVRDWRDSRPEREDALLGERSFTGVRLVRPGYADRAYNAEQHEQGIAMPAMALGAAGATGAGVAVPLDLPWTLSPSPREQSQDRSRPSARDGARRGGRGISIPGLEGIQAGVSTFMERLGTISNRLLVVLICLVVSAVFLYAPARELYSARRNEQILSTRLEHLASGNEKLQQSVASLQTREGIEDEAHKRGLVSAGETLVEVDGLSEYKEARQQEISELTSKYVDTTEIPVHLKILDFLFQYEVDA